MSNLIPTHYYLKPWTFWVFHQLFHYHPSSPRSAYISFSSHVLGLLQYALASWCSLWSMTLVALTSIDLVFCSICPSTWCCLMFSQGWVGALISSSFLFFFSKIAQRWVFFWYANHDHLVNVVSSRFFPRKVTIYFSFSWLCLLKVSWKAQILQRGEELRSISRERSVQETECRYHSN